MVWEAEGLKDCRLRRYFQEEKAGVNSAMAFLDQVPPITFSFLDLTKKGFTEEAASRPKLVAPYAFG